MNRHASKTLTALLLILLLPALIVTGCSRQPLALIAEERLPQFADDLNYASLETAVKRNLEYLRSRDPEGKIHFADKNYPVATLIQSQEFFLKLIARRPFPEELSQRIRENFDVFQATGTSGINLRRKMLVTGYYQPVFEGRLQRKGPYIYPLYSIPPDLIRQKSPEGKKIIGRMVNDKLVPYWTRKEIENGGKAAGLEIVWLKDRFDAFLLHIQGSGLIRLADGSLRNIHYAAKNGRQYRSIGKYMVQTGKIELEDAGIKTIRRYLERHPDEMDAILHHNPSFIFFEWSKTNGALGNLGKELTAGRSIAVDQSCLPPGALGFLFSRIPEEKNGKIHEWNDLHRFVVAQDTGSAIRGPGRVDLFVGTGTDAGIVAGEMKETGRLFFLILKDEKI